MAPIQRVVVDGIPHVLEMKTNLMSPPSHRNTYTGGTGGEGKRVMRGERTMGSGGGGECWCGVVWLYIGLRWCVRCS